VVPTRAGNSLVYFDRYFVTSVNAGRIRPLNWELWVALEDPIAQRLMEVLDLEFSHYGDAKLPTFDVETLFALIPLSGGVSFQRRRKQLEAAQAVLIRAGYLSKVERHASRGQSLYSYHAGPTFWAMRHRLKSTLGLHSYRSPLRDALDRPSLGSVRDGEDGVPGLSSLASSCQSAARASG
jgi:hypothetical protein